MGDTNVSMGEASVPLMSHHSNSELVIIIIFQSHIRGRAAAGTAPTLGNIIILMEKYWPRVLIV